MKDVAGEEFTLEVPEEGTLLALCSHHAVRVFEIERIETGERMILAHFDHDGWHHIYQGGDGINTAHLFFYLVAWQGERSPQDLVLRFFDNQFILCE